MATAQGINKVVAYKKQTALGTPASGSGGQKYRRRTSVFSKPVDTFENDEIVSHQQSTGVGIGGAKPVGKIDGLLSPGAYSDFFGSLLRRNFAAITPITGATITIAGTGPTYTVGRGAGSYLTDGVKVGHVVRLSAGAFNAANIGKNLMVLAVSALSLTVRPLNGVAMFAEGPIASSTVTVFGKVTYAPATGQTADYYTFEDYYPDVGRSETWPDAMIAKASLTIPASGNTESSFDVVARQRVLGAAQVLTAPAAEVGNDILTGAFGLVICNGSVVANITGATLEIDGRTTHGDLVLGANLTDDMQRGKIAVSGQFTAKFDAITLQTIFDSAAAINLVVGLAEDLTATADFVVFTLPAIKLTGDAPDDGEKQVIRTYPFTAQYNAAGGGGQASEQTILSIQDSAAA
jgi:hypothetical protein